MKKLFTSESVTEGHPDKICDQISDAILDAIITLDPYAHVACETCVTTGMVFIMGEISTNCYIDIPKIARNVIKEIGYHGKNSGFDYNTCAIICAIDEQSSDIAQGVNKAQNEFNETGAGDQGMMFGYACDETPQLMPLSLMLSHQLCRQLAKARKENILPYLLPDGKAQVCLEYDENNQIKRIDSITVSTQHQENITLQELRKDIKSKIIDEIIPHHLIDKNTTFFINPTGRFVIGGPQGDSGLTGRKIIVDTYGGVGRHGGGAFSGKDCTKVDRSGAYAARYIAKNIVGAKLATKCEVQLAYAIGVAKPVSICVNTFNTGVIKDEQLAEIVVNNFDLSVDGIINSLDLRKPIYRQLATYGQMGREEFNLPFEKLDKVNDLQKAIIFFTTTGNTQKMAKAIFDGMKEIDDSVGLFEVQNADVTILQNCTHIALGCPACGDEELDDIEFKPFFYQLLPHLENKHVALFGSYGWGNQEWMESWEEEVKNTNANLFEKGFTTLEEPDAEVLSSLSEFGKKFANQ